MFRPIPLSVLSFAFLAACADAPPASDVQRSDSAGVEIVTSGGEDRPLALRLEADFRLGGDDTDEGSFYRVDRSTVGTDDTARIYVLDPDNFRVVVFDSQGAFVRSQGSEGEGPGELQWPFALVVEPDGTALVFDLGKPLFVVYGPEGEPLPTRTRPDGFRGGVLRRLPGGIAFVDRAEEGFEVLKLRGEDGEETSLVRLGLPEGRSMELESCGMMISSVVPLFTPGLRWAAAGGRMAVAVGAGYSVDILDGDRVVRSVRRTLSPSSATRADAVEEVGDGMRVMTSAGERVCDPEEVVEQRGFETTVPLVGSLFLHPDGRLWVARGGIGGNPVPIDVFAPDGGYLGTLAAGTPLPLDALPDGRVLWEERDELDVERLVVGRLVEGGG